MIYANFDINRQLQDDLNMVDDCSMEVNNVTFQVSIVIANGVQHFTHYRTGQCIVGTDHATSQSD